MRISELEFDIIIISGVTSFIILAILGVLNKIHINIKFNESSFVPNKCDIIKLLDKLTNKQDSNDKMDTKEFDHRTTFEWFESNAYINVLNALPPMHKWLYNKYSIPIKITNESHNNFVLNNWEIPIQDQKHKHANILKDAFKLFREWKRWEINDDNDVIGWKYRGTKANMKVYTHKPESPNEVDLVKAHYIMPFSSAILCGLMNNARHMKEWDPKIAEMILIKQLTDYCCEIYVHVKMPFPLTDRDMVVLSFFYKLQDGSFIMGTKSIKHESYPDGYKGRIRCWCYLAIYHVYPDYNNNTNNCVCEYYCHMTMGGNLPTWALNMV